MGMASKPPLTCNPSPTGPHHPSQPCRSRGPGTLEEGREDSPIARFFVGEKTLLIIICSVRWMRQEGALGSFLARAVMDSLVRGHGKRPSHIHTHTCVMVCSTSKIRTFFFVSLMHLISAVHFYARQQHLAAPPRLSHPLDVAPLSSAGR